METEHFANNDDENAKIAKLWCCTKIIKHGLWFFDPSPVYWVRVKQIFLLSDVKTNYLCVEGFLRQIIFINCRYYPKDSLQNVGLWNSINGVQLLFNWWYELFLLENTA
jgi:hypothetical protein